MLWTMGAVGGPLKQGWGWDSGQVVAVVAGSLLAYLGKDPV